MNIDKRYVELLADVAPAKTNKWYPCMALLAFLILIIGMMIVANALFKPIGSETEKNQAVNGLRNGIILGCTGVVLSGASVILKNRERKKNRRVFIEYYEKNGSLPPWPKKEINKVK